MWGESNWAGWFGQQLWECLPELLILQRHVCPGRRSPSVILGLSHQVETPTCETKNPPAYSCPITFCKSFQACVGKSACRQNQKGNTDLPMRPGVGTPVPRFSVGISLFAELQQGNSHGLAALLLADALVLAHRNRIRSRIGRSVSTASTTAATRHLR
jgi:hypothetical protein